MNRRSFLTKSISSTSAVLLGRLALASPIGNSFPLFGENTPTVETNTIYGKIKGYTFNEVNIFKGIPYGGSTEGKKRFAPPTKPEHWKGVKDATSNGPRCVQSEQHMARDFKYATGTRTDVMEVMDETDSEDCLCLNVLTKGLKGKRPVMVYIHGGGFSEGSGVLTAISDKHVSEQDIVLVGVNHRLNVFGYTYLGGIDKRYTVGNPGQLDLIAALEWVRDNISNFGGDPNNVMIFGESGGGAKVSTLLAMPAAKGLFHKAAIQSGSFIRNATDAETATKYAKELMSKLRVTSVDELLEVSSAELFKAGSSLGPMGGGVVIDGHTLKRSPWNPDSPEISANIPLLIGCDKDETTLFNLSNPHLFELSETGLRTELIKSGIPENKVDTVLDLYHKDFPKETPSDLYFRINTDRGARYNATKQAELQLARGKAKVYLYYFKWNTPEFEGKARAFHTCDLPLTMRVVLHPESEQVSKQLSAAWASFAKNSNPSQTDLPWPSYTIEKRTTMVFDANISVAIDDPDKDERLMMKELPSGELI